MEQRLARLERLFKARECRTAVRIEKMMMDMQRIADKREQNADEKNDMCMQHFDDRCDQILSRIQVVETQHHDLNLKLDAGRGELVD